MRLEDGGRVRRERQLHKLQRLESERVPGGVGECTADARHQRGRVLGEAAGQRRHRLLTLEPGALLLRGAARPMRGMLQKCFDLAAGWQLIGAGLARLEA